MYPYHHPSATNFTFRELVDLTTSVLALCFALTVASLPNGIMDLFNDPYLLIPYFILYLITIAPAFVLHEMGHRFTAIKYGAEAHYQGFPFLILMMLLGAILFGVVFAATGAVVIFAQYLTPKERAEISLAGPKVNIVLSVLFLTLLLFLPFINEALVHFNLGLPKNIYSLVEMVLNYSAFINAFLAAFNLVPIFPLDGSKVIAYSFNFWAVWFGISLILLLMIKPEMISFILFLVLISIFLSSLRRTVVG